MSNQHYGPPPQQYGGPPGPPQQQYWGPPQGPPPGQPPYGGPPTGGPPYGGPPPGPGFGFGGNGYPPPKKKRSKAPFIVVPLVLLFAGVFALYLSALHAKQERRNNYSSPQSTRTYTTPTPPPSWPSSNSPRPTKTRPTRPTATQPRPTKTQAPPPSDVDLTARNRLYKTGVQKSVNCREPGDRPATPAGARKYYAAVIACLNRAWPAQVRKAGYNFVTPRLVSFWGSSTSPCAGNAPSSYYCSANHTIYMDSKGDIEFWRKNPEGYQRAFKRADMLHTVSHEYGHHIQAITGILTGERGLGYNASYAVELELSRRTEIQASCFGNVFMGSNRRTYPVAGELRKQLAWRTAHSGDEYGDARDHGSREIQPYWANRGFNSRNPGSCNTYVAGAQYVR